jgi:hypothetical protein
VRSAAFPRARRRFGAAVRPRYHARVIPCAYLRVYRPLDSFPEDERSKWERYILSGVRPARGRTVYRDEPLDGGLFGFLTPENDEHADVRLVESRYYVCPWQTRVRVMASMLSLREDAPPELADAFVPEAEARRVARELARVRRRDGAAPSILQSPWHVPVRWFVLFEDDERRLVESPTGGYRLYYWTTARMARERAVRAVQEMRRSELEPIVPLVRELVDWLSGHHPRSAVELDYGTISGLFAWDELDDDRSARDIQQAIRALSGPGGITRAGELYQGVATRWAEAKGRLTLN